MQGAGADALKERLRSLNVLIVDDNAFMRKIVRELLADLGVRHTIEAADGIAGLDAIRKGAPDLVILDLDMPLLDGFQFIRIVRTPGVFPCSDLPIIMLSGCSGRINVLEAQRLGVNEFLKKPVSANALFQRIASVLVKPRAMIEVDGLYLPEPRGSRSTPRATASGAGS
jgi:two-component system, chemotaxis family, chemotaxis protein CheY